MCFHVVWYIITDVLEENTASMFRSDEYTEDEQNIFH
jgi:hypothetical protein